MAFPLNKPTVGSINWGSAVNNNWTTIDNEVERTARKNVANGYVGLDGSSGATVAGTLTADIIFMSSSSGWQSIGFSTPCTDNGTTHEIAFTIGAGGDATRFGHSSTTYTTGGSIGWILNDMGYIYFNSSSKFRIGTSTSANTYVEYTSTALNIGSSLALCVLSTDQSTSTSSGAMTIAGGLGVAKNVCLDGGSGQSLRVQNPVSNGSSATTLGSVGPSGSTAGNPQGWMLVNISGTDRYVPFW